MFRMYKPRKIKLNASYIVKTYRQSILFVCVGSLFDVDSRVCFIWFQRF